MASANTQRSRDGKLSTNDARRLGVALCSLLASDQDEWLALAELYERTVGYPVGLVPRTGSPQRARSGGRWVAVAALSLAIAVAITSTDDCGEPPPVQPDAGVMDTGTSTTSSTTTTPLVSADVLPCVPVEQAKTATISLMASSGPSGGDWWRLVLAALLWTLGFGLLIRLPEELRQRQAETEGIEETVEWEDRNLPIRKTAKISRYAPDRSLVSDTARRLQTIGADVRSSDLDGLATVQGDGGGRWSVEPSPARLSDVGGSDCPDRCGARGVSLAASIAPIAGGVSGPWLPNRGL